MPRVKIVQPGFETYNGIIEGAQFNEGSSIESLSQFSAERIGAFMKVVNADNEDEPLGLGYRMANAKGSGVEPRAPLERIVRTKTGKTKEAPKKSKLISYEFTKDELELVADKDGIQGLRKVADQYEVRGRSISEIISSLMALKANQEAKLASAPPKANSVELIKPVDTTDIDSLLEG
jgi:hypothetical protein